MEKTDAPDVLPVILGGDIGAYSIARAFHEAYGLSLIHIYQRSALPTELHRQKWWAR